MTDDTAIDQYIKRPHAYGDCDGPTHVDENDFCFVCPRGTVKGEGTGLQANRTINLHYTRNDGT
ncbi:hypothetical protein, partial [Massilia sp. CT11-108]|uniref:hypothetical protein n=1 Tax=Massilia sp. CT11-108 TaxID=3393900 RepID=UPI0039A63F73